MTLDETVSLSDRILLDAEFLIWGEYEGELLGARPLALTPDSLKELFELHSLHPSIFSDLVEPTYERFIGYLVGNGRFMTEIVRLPKRDHVGLLYLTDLFKNERVKGEVVSAFGHFSFWDGNFSDRKELVRELIGTFAESLNMHRLSVRIPTYAPGAIRAAHKIGFTGDYFFTLPKRNKPIQVEAVLREATKYKGEWHDIVIMSLVGDELKDLAPGGGE